MTQRACSICQWWDPPALGDGALGYCHGAPPTASNDGEAIWPVTSSISFCGAFRIGEGLIGHPDRRLQTHEATQ